SKEDAAATWDHIHHSPCASIEKATRLLEYVPRYSSFQAIEESVRYLETIGKL
ncbi:MAG: NAD(P)-dependent oxidoreductase, partial [Spirochaetales bacterium]|nr:NAD(P)-dependent oxidoreductase [Spirochaetales bacterium]